MLLCGSICPLSDSVRGLGCLLYLCAIDSSLAVLSAVDASDPCWSSFRGCLMIASSILARLECGNSPDDGHVLVQNLKRQCDEPVGTGIAEGQIVLLQMSCASKREGESRAAPGQGVQKRRPAARL